VIRTPIREGTFVDGVAAAIDVESNCREPS